MQFMIEEEFVALMVNLIFLKWSNLSLLHKHVLSALLEQFWAIDSVVNSDTCEAEHRGSMSLLLFTQDFKKQMISQCYRDVLGTFSVLDTWKSGSRLWLNSNYV